MRLLFLTDSFRPSRSACANRVVVLVEVLRAEGIDVQVLASSDSLLDVPEGYEKPCYVTFFETFPLKEKTLINRLKNNFGGFTRFGQSGGSDGGFRRCALHDTAAFAHLCGDDYCQEKTCQVGVGRAGHLA